MIGCAMMMLWNDWLCYDDARTMNNIGLYILVDGEGGGEDG